MDTKIFGEELKRLGFCDFVGVPCSYLAPLINWAINENAFVMANNEGEAVAIASGISLLSHRVNSSLGSTNSACSDFLGSASASSLQRTESASHSSASHNPKNSSTILEFAEANSLLTQDTRIFSNANCGETQGDSVDSMESNAESRNGEATLHNSADTRKFGVVLMQNSGLSNALSPLTSLNHTFEIPILGFVSLRGEPNEMGENTDEPQHELLGRITHKILQTCEVEWAFLDSNFEEACRQLQSAKATLESNKSFFFIVRSDCFEKVALINNPLLDYPKSQGNFCNTKQSKINPCEAQPNLAPLRGAKKEKQGGSSASALLELEAENSEALPLKAKKRSFLARRGSGEEGAALFAKKSDYVNETNLTESRRSERVESFTESAESLKDSNVIDCHEFNKLNSHNDEATLHNSADSTKPTRLSALQSLQNLAQNAALLATTGKCGRELYELDDRANQLYMVGSMGCVSSLALGIALKARKKIIAIDGDSALLMRLGTLSGNAFYANLANKGNFCHILLDNESHDSTGGQFNLSPFTDFCSIAKSCGYAKVIKAGDLGEFERAIEAFLEVDSGGAWFVYLKIQKGSKKDLGRPKITPKQVALRFSAWVNG